MRGIRQNSSAPPAASSGLDPRQDRVSLYCRSEQLSTARRISNVWVLIWLNQKKILGLVSGADEQKGLARPGGRGAGGRLALISTVVLDQERLEVGADECHLLLDWLGSSKLDAAQVALMESAGVMVRKFHEPAWYHLARMNNRTHRKVLVVDGTVGFTGSVGIADAGAASFPQAVAAAGAYFFLFLSRAVVEWSLA